MGSTMVQQLLTKTHEGPVFGPGVAFPAMDQAQMTAMGLQVEVIARTLGANLYDILRQGFPELSDEAVRERVQAIIPKASCFCPALAALELADPKAVVLLGLTALAISDMYAADESTDRDDQAMLLAIEQLYGDSPIIPNDLATTVAVRQKLLHHMKATIERFALPEDAPYVLECYDQIVLHNEARLYRLSTKYRQLSDAQRLPFIEAHVKQLATLMMACAGVQSVAASLYTLYRRKDPLLPPLSAVHSDEGIIAFLQLCNTVARIADERGDWQMDAGHQPQKGVFSINPFNEYHPKMVSTFCELALMHDPKQIKKLQHAFKNFHNSDEDRQQYGEYVTNTFFAHAHDYINNLPPAFRSKYDCYIQLSMRVLEISHVNMMGDIAMGEQTA